MLHDTNNDLEIAMLRDTNNDLEIEMFHDMDSDLENDLTTDIECDLDIGVVESVNLGVAVGTTNVFDGHSPSQRVPLSRTEMGCIVISSTIGAFLAIFLYTLITMWMHRWRV